MLFSSPLGHLPFLILLFIGTCVGGSGDAQKEAPLATPEARSEGELPPTGLEHAASGRRYEVSPSVGRRLEKAGGRGRRRHVDYATRAPQWQRSQTHSAPNTMSQTLYDHFRPLDPELPTGDLLPFLQFGMKLPVAPVKVKNTLQGPSTTTVTPSTSTTFPSASTNALVDHLESDNEMLAVEEEPQSRAQAHASRAKLKAAIMLQMVVNSAKRKKLVQREQLRSKGGSKEVLKEEEGGVREWGLKMNGDEEEEEEESLIATNSKRRLVINRKMISGEDEDSDSEEVSGEITAFEPDESEEILQNDAPDEETFTVPPEIEAKDWKVAPAPKTLSTEELYVTESSEITSSPTILDHHSKDDVIPNIPNILPKTNTMLITSNKSSLVTDTDFDSVTISSALLTTLLPTSSSTTSSASTSPSPQTYPVNSSSLPTSASILSSIPSSFARSSPTPISSTSAPTPSSLPDSSSSSTMPYSPVNSFEASVTSLPLSSSSSPSSTPEPVSISPATQSNSTTTFITTTPIAQFASVESMEKTSVASASTTIASTTTPSITTSAKTTSSTTTPSTTTPSTTTPSTTTPSTTTPSTTTPSTTTPSTNTSSTTTSSATTPSTTTPSTTTPSTTTPSTTTPSTTMPSTTTTSTTTTSTTTTSTTTTSTTASTASPSTVSLPSLAPSSPPPQRFPTKIRLSQYPTLLSNHPVPSPPSLNSTRTISSRHPILHREHHRPPHLIFVPPSLRPPIPRRPFPPPSSIPAKRVPQVPTIGPSSPSPPKKELPVKAELDARDWVAVPPPNTTFSPSVSSTINSSLTHPLSTKPHPNKVEKGWQRPYNPPHSFPPFIPIDGHFSLPWQPAHVTSSTKATSQSTPLSTTGREVLSVVTSVSVESAPKVNPVSSTTTANILVTVAVSESGSVYPRGSSSADGSPNDIGLENHSLEYPHQVGVFAEENVDSDNDVAAGEGQMKESDPEVVAEPGMASTTTYILLSLAVVPGVVAIASAARCLLLHRKKGLYESETSSEVSCMGGRTLKTCSRSSQGNAVAAEERTTMHPTSDMFRVITRLPRVAHLGWENEGRRQRGKGGRNLDEGMLDGEEVPEKDNEHPSADSLQIGNWEFPRSKLRLQTLLGQGNFGQVWKAEADGICDAEGSTRLVAVKLVKVKDGDEEEDVIENTLSSPCTESPLSRRQGEHLSPMEQCRRKRREEFMAELGIMQLLSPPHPNVVTLLGCCTTTEPPLLIMEYVMFGKLLTFLREHKTKHRYANVSDDPEILTSRDLLIFAYCVIKGMEYLVSKGVVHRDLAARNILVDHNKICKIADFGMSRCVTDTGGQIYEEKQKQGALPVRWMAPESLFRGIFTHKSDVWSFGVLLWEILTLGSTPYPGIGARDVMRRVRDGRRLERPSHVRLEIFRVAARCWHRDPSLRPTFSRLRADMGPLLASSPTGINRSSGGMDSDMCLVSNRGNRRWRPPGPQIDLNQFEDDSG